MLGLTKKQYLKKHFPIQKKRKVANFFDCRLFKKTEYCSATQQRFAETRRSKRDRCPRSVFELHEQFHTLAGLAGRHKLMYVASGRHSDGDSLSPS